MNDRVLKLGRIFAVFALVASGGLTEVHAHPMPTAGAHHVMAAAPMHAACSALSSESTELAGRMMVEHHRTHDPRHPVPGTGSNCTCMGPCLDGSVITSPDVPVSVDLPAESREAGVELQPTPLMRQDPTAYLCPLPNAPPLA